MAAVLAATVLAGGVLTGVAVADETPSRHDVRQARAAVRDQADDVAAVRARLVVANQRLEQTAVRAAQAAEAYNGARWRAAQARQEAALAQRRAGIAADDLERQRQAYGDALVSSYELAPGLSALSAIVGSDGIDEVVQQTTTLQNAESALDANYDGFRAAATLADVSVQQAEDAEDEAARAAAEARQAKDAARAAADAAAEEAAGIADERTALIERLAALQHVSVRTAQRRQSALEEQAAAAAAAAAETEQAQAAAPTLPATPDPEPASQPGEPSTPPTPAPSTPAPSTPAPSTPAPPAPASGAQAAVAFARAQLGEPYRWGAAGPNAWDCSGLTMGAWGAGGTSLPHYSVAQYEQSTPITAGQLRPGDLVFWGSSGDPGSIYHVALYVGGGMIVHAPRTGRPVTEESMYSWTPPDFYARP
jgi:peptidoglycan DL-endopeptidase CwlO